MRCLILERCNHVLFLIVPPVSLYTSVLFFFNDTATTEIYTLSLHDALPIYLDRGAHVCVAGQKSSLEQRLRVEGPNFGSLHRPGGHPPHAQTARPEVKLLKHPLTITAFSSIVVTPLMSLSGRVKTCPLSTRD